MSAALQSLVDSDMMCESMDESSVVTPTGSVLVADDEEEGERERTSTGRIGPVLAISLIVALGGVIGGYSHGFPSPTLLNLQKDYERGERVVAFSSKSIYAGIFGVSVFCKEQSSPSHLHAHTQQLILSSLLPGHWSSGRHLWGGCVRPSLGSPWAICCAGADEHPSPDWLAGTGLRPADAQLYQLHLPADAGSLVHRIRHWLGLPCHISESNGGILKKSSL